MGERRAIAGHRRTEERSLLVVPRRRGWDPAERHAAWELDRVEPGWCVFYGPYRRRFYAIAAWPAPFPLVLDASDIEELRRQLRETETMHLDQGRQETTWP